MKRVPKRKLGLNELKIVQQCMETMVQPHNSLVDVRDIGGTEYSVSLIRHGPHESRYTVVALSWKVKFTYYDWFNGNTEFEDIQFKGSLVDFTENLTMFRLNT